MIFLASRMYSKLLLLSKWVYDSHTFVMIQRRQSASKPACPQSDPVSWCARFMKQILARWISSESQTVWWNYKLYGGTTSYMVELQTAWWNYKLYSGTTKYMVKLQTIYGGNSNYMVELQTMWWSCKLYSGTAKYMVEWQSIWWNYQLYGGTTSYIVELQAI